MKSLKAYNVIWLATMGLFLGVNLLIARSYLNMDAEGVGAITSQIGGLERVFIIGFGVFFVVIGNVLSTVRRNYLMGIRTPWTLNSDLTWEATHRLTARLWVGGGIATIISQAFLSAKGGLYVLLATILGGSVIALVYSYVYWRGAPDKRK